MNRVWIAAITLMLIGCAPAPIAPTSTLYVMPTGAQSTEVAAVSTDASATVITEAATIPPVSTHPATATVTRTPTLTRTPTMTRTPTLTRTPTNTATVAITADPTLVSYANQRDDLAWTLRTVKADFDKTFGQWIEGKVASTDPVWRATCESLMEEFDTDVNLFLDLYESAPAVFIESHQRTALGLTSCRRGFDYVYYAAVSGAQGDYNSGIISIDNCNRDWDAGDYAFWGIALEHNLSWPAMSNPTLAP